MSIDDSIIKVFCFIDDLLKKHLGKRGLRRRPSSAPRSKAARPNRLS